MRAASTGGGLVRLVVIWLVVLAALVIMTAAGASATSAAAAAAAAAAASATVTAATTVPATVTAAHRTAASPTPAALAATGLGFNATTVAATDEAATVTTGSAGEDAACAPIRVSLRKPACTGQISEGPGPPSSRCPTARPCGTGRTDSDDKVNVNYYNNDKSKRNNDNDNDNNNNNNNINDNDNNNNNNTSNHTCLEYARRDRVPEMCPDDPGAYSLPGRLSQYRLRHCCHHTVESVVQQPYTDQKSCSDQVHQALDMDDIAAAMSCQFNEVLARYDCQQNYSAMSCDSCKDAYALWVCAAILPHWTRTATTTVMNRDRDPGRRYRVNACQSVCLEAEQKCPWLLPVADEENPYAGEAAFTCIDPDIGYKHDCCYEHCGDGLCVRNASTCAAVHGGGGGGRPDHTAADQRPVCVQDVPLKSDESECPDYSLTDTSGAAGVGGGGGGGRWRRTGTPGTVALSSVLTILWSTWKLARAALATTTTAVT